MKILTNWIDKKIIGQNPIKTYFLFHFYSVAYQKVIHRSMILGRNSVERMAKKSKNLINKHSFLYRLILDNLYKCVKSFLYKS